MHQLKIYLKSCLLGLDIHDGCSPVLTNNVYKCDAKNGAESSNLKFDIVKVRRKSENYENIHENIITVGQDTNEKKVVEEIMR